MCLVDDILVYGKTQEEQRKNEVFRQLKQFCQEGWPDKSQLRGPIKAYIPMMTEVKVYFCEEIDWLFHQLYVQIS